MQTEFARGQMITQQVRAWDVLDERVLDAMRRTPREFFVPETLRRARFRRHRHPARAGPAHAARRKLSDVSCRRWKPRPACARWWSAAAPDSCRPASRPWARACAPSKFVPELAQAAQRNLKRPDSDRSRLSRVTLSTWISARAMRSLRYVAPCPCTTNVSLARWPWVGSCSSWSGASLPQEALLVTRTGEQTWNSTALFETAIDPLDHAPWPERFEF